MQKIIYEIFTNRLGNVLAIGNLVLIAINASGLGPNTWAGFSLMINLPARLASVTILGNPFLPYPSIGSFPTTYAFGTLIFVYLQWVGIGWLARKISESIQPHLSKLL